MESQRFGTMQEAVAEALAGGLRQRAVCYVTRGRGEVLAIRHIGRMEDGTTLLPGVQVPGGGLNAGEAPAHAAIREVFEETGLNVSGQPHHLGSSHYSEHNWTGMDEVWHYFQLSCPLDTSDLWLHVASGEDDVEMHFEVWFTPVDSPEITDDYGSHEYLPELISLLQEPS